MQSEMTQLYEVRFGRVAPPHSKSLGRRAVGTVKVEENRVTLHIKKVMRETKLRFVAVGLPILCLWVLLYSWIESPDDRMKACNVVFAVGFLVLAAWEIWETTLRKTTFHLDLRKGAAYYFAAKKIICLELPDGKWMSFQTQSESQHAELLEMLSKGYGDRFKMDEAA